LEELGEVGPYHLDIDGSAVSGGAARGPFETKKLSADYTATYPILDSHAAERERTLQIEPDSQGIPRVGTTADEIKVLEQRRDRIWTSRSRLHLNTDFRFNSQTLAFSITAEPSLGGRAWPTFKTKDATHDILVSLWCNSSFCLLSYWWSANKAQDGRGSITTSQMPKFSVLDPRELGAAKLKKASTFFDKWKSKPMLQAHKLADDPVRAKLDEFILKELLDCGADLSNMIATTGVLRRKLGQEPSFNGGRK
ncbi:MAG: hypothetical protein ACRD2L_13495, partial [Terriglobia bacterium]